MLNLDDVSWGSLGDPTGKPTDVPVLLRKLSSPAAADGSVARDLLPHLWSEGTVYDVTAPAVPFLIELIGQPTTPRRDHLALILGLIADAGIEAGVTNSECQERVSRGLSIYLDLVKDAKGDQALTSALLYLTCHYPEAKAKVVDAFRPLLEASKDDDFGRLERILTRPDFTLPENRRLPGLAWPSPRFWNSVEKNDPRAASLDPNALAALWKAETLAVMAYVGGKATHFIDRADRAAGAKQ